MKKLDLRRILFTEILYEGVKSEEKVQKEFKIRTCDINTYGRINWTKNRLGKDVTMFSISIIEQLILNFLKILKGNVKYLMNLI